MKAHRLSGTLFAVASALAIILCLIIVIYTVPGLRPLFTYPGFMYLRFEEADDGTLKVKYCSRYAAEVEIPSRIGGKAVTRIGEHAFRDCRSLEELVLPDSILTIEENAFERCLSLKKIDIPAGVSEIGATAFLSAGIETLTVPDNIQSIGYGSFSLCENLEEATITEGVESIGTGVFRGCKNLKKAIIPKSATDVGIEAFAYCENLTSVGGAGSGADVEFGWDGVIPSGVFRNMQNLTEAVLPDGIAIICEQAFFGCENLQSVTIPDSVVYIGEYVFSGCGDLTIYGKPGSYAEGYSAEHNINFEPI